MFKPKFIINMKKILLLTILFLLNINFSFSQNTTYPNGQIKEKGNKQNGEYISYYQNGQIMEKGNYVEWKKNGVHFKYYENGQIMEKGNYVEWKQSGEFFRYYENGQIKEKGNYVEGKKNGVHFKYYENGQIMEKGNGSIIKEPLVDLKSNVVGLRYDNIGYDRNGKIYYLEKNISFSGKFEGGLTIMYNEDGSIKKKNLWKDGFSDEEFKKLCQKYNIN